MSRRTLLAALLVGVVLHPVALAAQAAAPAHTAGAAAPAAAVPATATPADPGIAPLAVLAGRLGADAREGLRARATSLEPLLAPYLPARHRQPGVALMIVGGAGIVVGSLIDSGLVTVAGAGVGLYGLYLYLR